MAAAHAEANREFWDKHAAAYDTEPWQQKLTAQVSSELRGKLDFIGAHWSTGEQDPRKVRLLDYACGTGSVSRALAPYVSDIRGIDISQSMVNRYNGLAKDPNMKNAKALVGDLFTEARPSDELATDDLSGFDIVVVGFALHHFASPALAISRLAERVAPGGVLLIIDFLEHGPSDESIPAEARHTVKSHGFSREGMGQLLEDTGMEGSAFSVMEQPVELMSHGQTATRKVFLARAVKPKPDETL